MVNIEMLLKIVRAQVTSTRMWVDWDHRYKDEASRRNALLACGKLAGMVQVLQQVVNNDLPADVYAAVEEFQNYFANL